MIPVWLTLVTPIEFSTSRLWIEVSTFNTDNGPGSICDRLSDREQAEIADAKRHRTMSRESLESRTQVVVS